jgi:hypothetical protein
MSKKNYRPYFSQEELTEVTRCVSVASTNTRLIGYLRLFLAKIENEQVSVQYTNAPSIEEKLGLEDSPPAKQDLKAQRFQAYNKWLESPAKCSILEHARAQMYRYENDLMSPEEESSYEQKLDRGY